MSTLALWMMFLQTFRLNNYNLIDTTTIIQALSSTLYSHLFFYTNVPGGLFFATHATTFFFAILPSYSIYPNFITLYAIQYVLVYSPAISIYLMGKRILNDGKYAFLFSVAFLVFTFNIVGLYPTEEILMFIGPAIFSIYFLEIRRKIPFIIAFVLMLSTIEFAPIIGGFFFLYILIDGGFLVRSMEFLSRKIGTKGYLGTFKNFFLVSALVLSVFFFFFDSWMTLYFSGGTHPITVNLQGVNIFSLHSLLNGLEYNYNVKFSDLFYIEGPFLFLSFMDPIILVQLPWFLSILFTTTSFYFSVGTYYQAFIAAFIPAGALFGIRRMSNGTDPSRRPGIKKKIVIIVLVLTLVVSVNAGTVQYIENVSVGPITAQDQALVLLSEQLRQGEFVNVNGPNDLPVTAIYDWNDTYYGGYQWKDYIFSGSPYYSLNGYGFYAAAGPFILYEKNYSSAPDFNYYNYSGEAQWAQPTQFSFFSPPGNYTLSLNITKLDYSQPVVTGSPSDKNFSLSLGKAIAIPFRTNHSEILKAIAVVSNGSNIYYYSGLVTSSIGPISIASAANAEYPFQYFSFNNMTILANTTYYFWYFPSTSQPANHGSTNVSMSSSAGSGYIGNVANNEITNISKLNFTIPIILLFKSDTPTVIPIRIEANGIVMNGTLGGGSKSNSLINLKNGQQLSLLISTDFVNYLSYYGSTIGYSYHYQKSPQTMFILNNPAYVFISVIIIGIGLIIAFSRINFKSRKSDVFNASISVAGVSFLAFWTFFGLSWYEIIPFLYNVTLFRVIGIIFTLSLLASLITYDWQ